MNREDYASRVADLAEREEGARLFLAMQAANEALQSAWENDGGATPEVSSALDELNAEHRRKYQELEAWYEAERVRIVGPDPMADARNAADAATQAYNDAPGSAVAEDDEGGVMRCALSGAPIYEDDDTITIGEKTVLAALFVPGDVIAALKDDGEEEIEEAA